MTERNYYVICDDNCKFEGMTKEEIYDAIAEATGATPTLVDQAFITQIKEQNANASMKIWKGTEAQFNALASKAANTLYFIGTDEIRSINDVVDDIEELQNDVATIEPYVADTGWVSIASAINTAYFDAGTVTRVPKIRKIGKMVCMKGDVTAKSQLNGGYTLYTNSSLPFSIPQRYIGIFAYGTNNSKYFCGITTNGGTEGFIDVPTMPSGTTISLDGICFMTD